MSKRFKLILIVRFIGYLVFFSSVAGIVFMLGPIIQAEAKYRLDKAFKVKRTVAEIVTTPDQPTDSINQTDTVSDFSSIETSENSIVPVSTEYGIVIEKINANARIVPNVNPAKEKEYTNALKDGVAEALGSTLPGQPGNLYLFSHSTDAPWNIVRFNAIFYLLRELEAGDKVIIFKNHKRYDYIVFDKVVVNPNDVSYLTNRYDYPVLTLQTCDPPGTLLNRLVVRAKLVSN